MKKSKIIIFMMTLLIIIATCFAFAKYVLFSENNVTVTLKDGKISETQITSSPSAWTNKKVTVTIESDKGGDIYYKVGQEGVWTKYSSSFDVLENDTVYSKLVFEDANGPETLKDITNIDKVPPTKTAPVATATSNKIIVTSKQEDHESGIVYEEYAIKKDGEWIKQQLNNFEGLKCNTVYVVKTISTDLAGNVSESEELEVKTEDMTPGILTFKKETANGEILDIADNIQSEKKYINNNVYFQLAQGENGTTTYKVVDSDGNEVTVTDNILNTNTGTYIVTLTTTDGTNIIEKNYYIYIDKTVPTSTAPNVVGTTGKIIVTNNQTDLESGIDKIEYGIYDETKNSWIWQTENEFSSLKPNTEYRVKTRATDKAGNVSESEEVTITTKELSGATIIIKENDENKREIIPSTSENDENKDWTNKDVIIDVSAEEETTVNVVVKDKDGKDVTKKEDGSYGTSDGTYEITVTTEDKDGNTKEDKYYIFVDKTKPTITLNPNGSEYIITPANTQTKISVTANAEDSGSGIDQLQYAWSTSNTQEPSEWSAFVNNKSIDNLVDGGTYYLWTKVVDKAGNVADQRVSNAYVVKYKIIYNANGGENAPEAQIKFNDIDLTLSEDVPTRTGYTFIGWAKSSSAVTAEYLNGGIYTENKAIQLYAVWKVNEYTVTFDYNAPNYTENETIKRNYNSKLGTLPTGTREGYVFDGWYTEKINGTEVSSTTVITGDVIYYAHWTAIKYTVKYDGNGSTSGEMEDKEVSYDETFDIATNAFSKTGYSFKEWNTTTSGSGISYKEGATVSNLTSIANNIVTLYAIWEDITAPNTTAPVASSDVSSVTVVCKQTDDGSGIDESTIEYGINKNGTWEWQKDSKFTGLNSDTEYEVKTRASDKSGNGPVESESTKMRTTVLQLGDLIFKKDNENGEQLTPATTEEEEKNYINNNVYIEVKPSENGTTTYTVEYNGGEEQEFTSNQILTTKTGTYTVNVKTKTESETYSKTYIIYIDKTNPTLDAPTVVSTTGTITVTNNQADLDSGIAKIEYAILIDGTWNWQSTGVFSGLKQSTKYEVKTKTTDKAGNFAESESVQIYTKDIEPAKIKITKAETGDVVTPSTTKDDESKEWINDDVKIELTTPEGLNSEVHVYKEDESEVTKSSDGNYVLEDGTYKVVATTKDDQGNSKDEVYYIFVDKTKPIVTVNPDGGKYVISVGQTSTEISATINVAEQGSGIQTLQYAWSSSQTIIPNDWSMFENGGLVTKSVTGGNYYLWINVKDKAGNKADKIITNAYKVVYTIEYDANGGENAPESQEKLNDVDTKISSSIPNKSGYTFKGWAEFNSATTAKYQPGDTYSDNESVKLYAIWEANTYKINYNLNGGTFNTTQDTTYIYNTEKKLPTSKDITKAGYDFDGWYDESDNKVTTLPAGTIGDVNLQAHWTARTDTKYVVKYYLENANNSEYSLYSTENRAGTTDKIIELKDVQIPTQEIQNATYKNTNLTETTKIDPINTTVVNVYYSRNTFELNLIAGDNISSVTGANTYKWGQSVNISATIDNLEGYTYKWNTWTSSDTTVLPNQANQNTTITMPTSSITLTASATRTIVEYTITKKVKQDGVINENKTQTLKYNVETPDFDLTTDDINGYTFKGWTLNDEPQMYQTVTIKVGTTGDKVYTAVFVDETEPSTDAPTGTSTTNEITIKCNQTDAGSGIDESTIEYGIYKDNEWKWQSTSTFEGLDADTDYKVKTRVKDNNGNGPTESKETTISTKAVNESTLTFRKTNSTGEIVNFPSIDDSSVWVNTDIHVTPNITQTSGTTTTYKIVDKNGTQVNLNSDSILLTETGKYIATITTTDGVNEKTITYYLYVDKTLPVVQITPNGGNYYIPVGSTSTTVTATLTATDDGGSNLNTLQYGWSSSNTTPPQAWSNFENGKEISKSVSGGISYLWTNVTDIAGNEAKELKCSAAFKTGYTIEYDANGGQNAPGTEYKNHNVNYTISETEPTKQGYTFIGWSTSSQATTAEYNKSSVYNKNESIKLYAVWKANTYNITYNLNGGSFTSTVDNKYTYNEEKTLPTGENVQKAGYDFAGWYNENGEIVTVISAGTINDITLSAQWTPKSDTKYTVYYYIENINDNEYSINEGLTETKTGTTDSVITLKTLEKTLEGMTCAKKAIVENGNNVESTKINGDGTTKIYMYYTRNTYTLTVSGNENIESTVGTGTYKYEKEVDISAIIKSMPGYAYSWVGWTSSDITVPTLQSTTIKMPAKNVTITANASKELINYQINYDLAGGNLQSGVSNPGSYNIESNDIKLNNPEKQGYTFNGWILDGTNLGTDVTIKSGTIGNKNYTASWKINSYTVTYNYSENGGTNSSKTSDLVEYDKSIDLTPIAEKNGYTFVGWNTNANAKEGLSKLTMETSDVVLYAIYSKQVSVKFDKNGGQEDIVQNYTLFNKEVSLSINTPNTPTTRDGWTFLCYGISKDDIEGVSKGEKITVNISEDKNELVYYTNWKKDITVTFIDYLKTEKNTTTKNVTAYNGNTTSVEAPTQNEYTNWTCAGWTNSEDPSAEGINKDGGIINNISDNITYYGLYIQNIQINYELNGSTSEQLPSEIGTKKVNSSNIENVNNPEITISSTVLEKPGYTFNNYKDLNGRTYEAGKKYTFTQTTTLSAEWTLVTYTIEYDLDGGVLPEGITNPNSYTVENNDITLNEPTKTGYKFSGWQLDGETTLIKPGIIKKGSTGNRKYIAKWSNSDDTEYKIQFYYQTKGIYSDVPDSSIVKTGTTGNTVEVSEDEKKPTKTGYVFDESKENVLTGIITPDGNLTLKVYFKQQFTVKYLPGAHGAFNEQSYSGLDYNADIPTFEGTITAKPGYTFANWNPSVTGKVTEDKTYTAEWTANTDTEYKIEYYYQNNGVYADTTTEFVSRTGTTDTTVSINDSDKEPSKVGYTFDEDANNILDGTIAGDGSLVLKVYFKQQFTVKYLPGVYGTFEIQTYENLDYGSDIPEFSGEKTGKPGYSFANWNPAVSGKVTEDKTYTAEWVANTDTAYKIEYYYQNNGVYAGTTTEFVSKTGTTGASVTVSDADKITSKTGYVFDESAANVLSGTIKGDGSLVLKVYFKQQFTVKYLPGTYGTFEEQIYKNLDYGSDIPEFSGNKTGKPGYTFSKWNPIVSGKVNENKVYTAEWRANTDTTYTVEYYYQNDGKYADTATEHVSRAGTTDTTATVEESDKVASKTGYVFDENANNILTGTIAGDGSLVLKLYFKQQFTVKYLPGVYGTFETQTYENLDYGSDIPEFSGEKTGKPGYSFANWNPTVTGKVTEDKTYTAEWTPNTNTVYTVEYYYQKDGEYANTTTEFVSKVGTTDTIVTVEETDKVTSKAGYVFDESASNILTGTIAGDGSLVLKVYFKQQFTIKYVKGEKGTFAEDKHENLDYGSITPGFGGEKTGLPGYTFSKWNPDVAETVTEDKTYTAEWTANTNTPYTVHIYGENAENTEYTFIKDVTKYGTTDASINTSEIQEIVEGYGDTSIIAKDKLGNIITNVNINGDGSSEVYLYYSRNTYKLNLAVGQNIESVTGEGTYKWGSKVTINAVIKSASGKTYNWLGWTSSNKSILGDQSEQNATITMPIVPKDETLTLTANATANANEYSITWVNVDDVDNSNNPNKYTYGTAITFKNPGSKTGYTFKGWYKDENFTESITGITETQTGNITVYAKWDINKYTVTYNALGGTCDTSTIEDVPYGAKVNVDPKEIVASKPNYVFKGWSTDATATTPLESLTMGTSDIILYAVYVEAVAQIGDNYYETVQDAIDAAKELSGQTTIIVLKSVTLSENIGVVAEGQDIILNLNDKTLKTTNTSSGNVIVNNGKLEITGPGEINAGFRGITNNTNGTLEMLKVNVTSSNFAIYNLGNANREMNPAVMINNGNIESTQAATVYNNSNGYIYLYEGNYTQKGVNSVIGNMAEGTIDIYKATIEKSGNNGYPIYSQGGKVVVGYGTVINSTKTSGIYAKAGNLTIGSSGGVVNTTTPEISVSDATSGAWGVQVSSSVNFEFYDGVIKGTENKSISTNVTPVTPDGYGVQKTNADGFETAILVQKNYAEYDASTNNVKNYYSKLADATKNAVSGNTIKPLENTIERTGGSSIGSATIDSGKKVILDLNGKVIVMDANSKITNNGELQIQDTLNGTLQTSNYIANYGTLTVNSGNVVGQGKYHTIISNSETSVVNVNGGTLKSEYDGDLVTIQISKGNLNITEGTFTSKYRCIQSAEDDVSGEITITGGNFVATGGAKISYQAEPFYIAGGTLNITGGTFTGEKGEYSNAWGGQIGANVTAKITGGTFTGDLMGLGIYNNITIDGATIIGKEQVGLCNMDTGTVQISNSNISSTEADGIINNSTGAIILKSGVVSGGLNGIKAADGTVTLGVNENPANVSITTPSITGGLNGVNIASDATFNFYDGIIKGSTAKSIVGVVSNMPNGYAVKKTTADDIETAILVAANYAEYNAKGTIVNYYATLGDAFSNSESESTIKPLANTVESVAANNLSGKTQTLDLNGKLITMKNASINNRGTLSITGNGTIITTGANTFNNNGTLNITTTGGTIQNKSTETYRILSNQSGVTTVNSAGSLDSSFVAIANGGTAKFILQKGTITATSNAIYNAGTLNTSSNPSVEIKGGTVESTGANTIYNYSTGLIKISGGNINQTRKNSTISNDKLGTIEVTGGTILKTGTAGSAIFNNSSGKINVSGGTIKSEVEQGIRGYTGTVNISGGTITGSSFGASTTSGTIEVTKGTIEANGTSGAGLYTDTGTLTIGTNESTPVVSTTIPSIKGAKFGVWRLSTDGTINFYDGVIIAPKGATIMGTVNGLPTDYGVVTSMVNSLENATLAKSTDRVCRIGTHYFTSIQNAINYADTDTSEIVMLKTVSQSGTQGTISQGQSITLNLATFDVTSTSNITIVNKGSLNVTGSGTLSSTGAYNAISNTGTLTLTSGTVKSTGASDTITNSNAEAIITVNGGTISSEYNGARRAIFNSLGNVNINKGTLTSKYRCIETGANNTAGAINITGGTIKATGGSSISAQAEPFYITSGTLNISGGDFIGEIGDYTNAWAGQIGPNVTPTITGGNFTGKNLGLGIYSTTGTVKISNATINCSSWIGIVNFSTATLDITDSTITGTTGIDQRSTGEIIINSGEITGTGSTGAGIKGTNSVTIKGGTVTATGTSGVGINAVSGNAIINNGTVSSTGTSGTGITSGTSYITINNGYVKGKQAITKTDVGTILVAGGEVTSTATETIALKYGSKAILKVTGGTVACPTTAATAIKNESTGIVMIGTYGDKSMTSPKIQGGIFANNTDHKDDDGYVAEVGDVRVDSGLVTATTSTAINSMGTVDIYGGKITASKSFTIILADVKDSTSTNPNDSFIKIHRAPIIENTGGSYAVTTYNSKTQNVLVSMDGGTISSTSGVAINNQKGTTWVYGGTIVGGRYGIFTTTGTIEYEASVSKVNSVSAIGSTGIGMYATTGTISLGKDSGLLESTPTIKGVKYGIQISGKGTLNFYDCIVYGGTSAIENAGTLNIKSTVGTTTYGVNTSTETTTIGSSTMSCEKKMIVVRNYTTQGSKGGNCYDTLRSALSNIKDNELLSVMNDVTETDTDDYVIDKNISWYFYGHTLDIKSTIIVNKGVTVSLGTNGSSGGTLTSSDSITVNNQGTLNIGRTTVKNTFNQSGDYCIQNSGELILEGSKVISENTVSINNTGVGTLNCVNVLDVKWNNIIRSGSTTKYAIESNSTAENPITIDEASIYGYGGGIRSTGTGSVSFVLGQIIVDGESSSSTGIYASGNLTIGNTQNDVTSSDATKVPIIKSTKTGIYAKTNVYYYNGIIYYSSSNPIRGTATITPRTGYSVTTSTESVTINNKTLTLNKAMLSK